MKHRTFASYTWKDWGLGLSAHIGQHGFRYTITLGPINVVRLSAETAALYRAHAQKDGS